MEIKAEQISYSIGAKQILRNVRLHVPQSKFIGVIGPNGSGKSTFLKCIYRTLKPQTGTIFFDGSNINDLSCRESALKLAVVAQHNFCNFDFKVEEVVLLGRSPHKKIMESDTPQDYEIVRSCLRKVGMEACRDRSFNTLSGGEQQRVILARALAQQTECLVLDEPTNHLDINYQLQIMEIVRQTGLTVIAAIHDLNIASMYCDYIYAVKDGEICGSGSPQKLLMPDFIYTLYKVRTKIIYDDDSQQMIISYLKNAK